jgi:SAM-dependent methyltransferase
MSVDERRWLQMVDALDVHLAGAIQLDISQRGLTGADIAWGYSELAKLRHTGEPDYNVRGVAVAYAFSYFTQRALSVALAVSQFDELPNPLRVLDIGSGTGAAKAGLNLGLPGWTIHVIAVEPAAAMREQAAFYTVPLPGSLEVHAGTLDDVLDRAVLPNEEAFDLVILSAALGYGFGSAFTEHELIECGLNLVRRLAPSGRMLLIEPEAKQLELSRFARALARSGTRNVVSTSNDLTPFPLQHPMPRMTELIMRLHHDIYTSGRLSDFGDRLLGPPWPIESWAKSPDHYLVADSGLRSRTPLPAAYPPKTRHRIRQLRISNSSEHAAGRLSIPGHVQGRDWALVGAVAVAAVAAVSWIVGAVL